MMIREVMTRGVHTLEYSASLREAARLMAEEDIGSVPVVRDEQLVGMVTDRDLVIRGLARSVAEDAPLSTVMTPGIRFCFDDQSVEEVASIMAELGVRRLPVVDREKRLVGFISLANINGAESLRALDTLLDGVATPH
ncbi:CBS domain-containing protein [Pseudomarimonas salicorniae]|uniref:CBS domain-containing protein n=1 Tax=Pseudomarimonas salicorniae TaxID=2933270 RepID=A0ABT0GL29_9GAMM|nr:CBS domain-containing protein [Lysobacter sp. CAU 1642]MCK7595241.1 CBS domain-containing protein [Lysobacter sp. CAU 1642]